MLALVDGDLVCYRCAASAENDEVDIACLRAGKLMEEILADVGADSHRAFLTHSSSNFRKTIDPQYKANRKDVVRPRHLPAVQEFLVTYFKAEWCNGYEADDALGSEQRASGTIICTLDKDLKQVPGNHYNWVKKEFSTVSEEEGLLSLYTSSLVGDRSDNIIGVAGLGVVKAARALEGLTTEAEMYQRCRELYNDDERFHRNMQLLYIWRSPNDIWQPPGHVHHCGEDVLEGKEDVLDSCDCISGADVSVHTGGCPNRQNNTNRAT